jgi:hypothetical protein
MNVAQTPENPNNYKIIQIETMQSETEVTLFLLCSQRAHLFVLPGLGLQWRPYVGVSNQLVKKNHVAVRIRGQCNVFNSGQEADRRSCEATASPSHRPGPPTPCQYRTPGVEPVYIHEID